MTSSPKSHWISGSLAVPVLAVLLVALGLISYGDTRKEHEQATIEMKQQLQPLVSAIEQYCQSEGRYPQSIDILIAGGFITNALSVPVASSHYVQTKYIAYNAGPAGSFYHLRVGYDWDTWAYQLYYISFLQEWQHSKYPPRIEHVTLQWYGQRYQKSRSMSDLAPVLRWLVGWKEKNGFRNFDRHYITKDIGPGIPVTDGSALPDTVAMAEDYECRDESPHRFRVCYREQTDSLLKGRDDWIVDDIYQAVVDDQGRTQWRVLTEADLPPEDPELQESKTWTLGTKR